MTIDEMHRLSRLLKDMNLPVWRKDLTMSNMLWVKKNLHVRNSNRSEFNETLTLVKKYLKGE